MHNSQHLQNTISISRHGGDSTPAPQLLLQPTATAPTLAHQWCRYSGVGTYDARQGTPLTPSSVCAICAHACTSPRGSGRARRISGDVSTGANFRGVGNWCWQLRSQHGGCNIDDETSKRLSLKRDRCTTSGRREDGRLGHRCRGGCRCFPRSSVRPPHPCFCRLRQPRVLVTPWGPNRLLLR